MTTKAAPAAVPGPLGDPGAAAARRPRTILRQARDLAGVLPFTVYVLIGLVLPMGAILLGAFKTPVTGGFTWHNLHIASHGIYLHGFATSMELSLIASIVPGILGFLVAYAIYTAKRGAVLRRVASTPGATRTSCPAVSSSASRSPARWRSSLRSCCLTSRSRHSMPRSGCSCGRRSGPCSSGSARRPSSSRMTRRRPCRWRTESV